MEHECNFAIINKAYSILKPNEAYWLIDNDYAHKYRYICEAVELRPNYAPYTYDNIAATAKFMIEAHNRIFK